MTRIVTVVVKWGKALGVEGTVMGVDSVLCF